MGHPRVTCVFLDKCIPRLLLILFFARTLILEQLQICSVDTRRILDRFLALESHPPFTQNFEAFSSEKKKWLGKYERARWPHDEVFRPVPATSTDNLYRFPTFLSKTDLSATPVTWTIEEELQVMARVQAYFQVAYQVSAAVCLSLAIAYPALII